MNMIGHKAEAMDTAVDLLGNILENQVETIPVTISEKMG